VQPLHKGVTGFGAWSLQAMLRLIRAARFSRDSIRRIGWAQSRRNFCGC